MCPSQRKAPHMCMPRSQPRTGWNHSSERFRRHWDKVQRHANDKSMFAEPKRTVSSEWIGNGRTKGTPFPTPPQLRTGSVEGSQMSKRNWCFWNRWCMCGAVGFILISSNQSWWILHEEKSWRKLITNLLSLSMQPSQFEALALLCFVRILLVDFQLKTQS